MSQAVDQDEPRRFSPGRFLLRLAMQLTVTLVLYVLSIGPLFWEWHSSKHSGEYSMLAGIYWPLEEACEASPTIRKALSWYIEMWNL